MTPEDARFYLAMIAGAFLGWTFRGMWESSWEQWTQHHRWLAQRDRERTEREWARQFPEPPKEPFLWPHREPITPEQREHIE